MNRFIPLMLVLVLLTGCAAQNPVPGPTAALPVEAPVQDAPFLMPAEDGCTVPKYILPEDVHGFLLLGENLLFFSEDDATTLTLVDPVNQQVLSTYETGMVLTTQNFTVQQLQNGFSYFDGKAGETVVLDSCLQQTLRLKAPDDLAGMPLLSPDGSTQYYCTSSGIRALDIATGISRILREASYPVQGLSGILLDGAVLQVSITEADGSWRTLFLSSETGQLLEDRNGNVLPETKGNRFFLHQQEENRHSMLFGTVGEPPMVLNPWFDVDASFFLGDQVLTVFTNEIHPELQLYTLDSGLRQSCLLDIPSEATLVNAAQDSNGCIWLLFRFPDAPMLCCWDPAENKTSDTTVYTSPRYTRLEPDLDALAACTLHARDLSHLHGIEILVYTDAVAMQPRDYTLEYEYDAAVLYRELELLDRRLNNYPPGFLQALAGKFTGITISIVRSIQGTPESGNTNIADGISFWNGYEAYIVLAAGSDTERTLYHELCHLIDTVVLTESTAYDRWESLNPTDFSYANSASHTMDADDWRQAGWESFLNNDSISYPKEDRAYIMEYAMIEGNAGRFESPYLQAKLKLLCTGIREAFGLEKWTKPLLWEQYLHVPLTF